MAQELSLLCGYGSGEDEDDAMLDGEDAEGAGGKVVLVGHGSMSQDEQEDESMEDVPLQPQPQPQPQPQARPAGEDAQLQREGESPTSHINGAKALTGQEAAELDDEYAILPEELRTAPPGQCDPDIQQKVANVLEVKTTQNKLFSRVLEQTRGYRNPDFLEKMITHFNIQERGSSFGQDVFDPYGLPAEDFIDALEKQLAEQRSKKEQERMTRKQIDFAKGGVQPAPVPKPLVSSAAAQAGAQAMALKLTRRGWDK